MANGLQNATKALQGNIPPDILALPGLKQDSEKYATHAETVAEMLAKGCSVNGIASIVGIDRATIEHWQTTQQFSAFVARKREERRLKMLSNIERASEEPRAWQAGAWILERTYKGEYDPPAVKQSIDVSVNIFKHIQVDDLRGILDETPVIEAVEVGNRVGIEEVEGITHE